MLKTNYDVSKIFIWNNRYSKANFTNGTGSEVTLSKGLVLGRISASGLVKAFESAASDGSNQPLGILADDYKVGAGATVTVTYCDGGDVAVEKIILSGSDTLDTVVTGVGRVRDLIARNTTIKLVAGTELTGYDN